MSHGNGGHPSPHPLAGISGGQVVPVLTLKDRRNTLAFNLLHSRVQGSFARYPSHFAMEALVRESLIMASQFLTLQDVNTEDL